MANKVVKVTLLDAHGRTLRVTVHATPMAAKRSMSAAQRKLYNARVWALPGGGYDIFPAGHPVPLGAIVAE